MRAAHAIVGAAGVATTHGMVTATMIHGTTAMGMGMATGMGTATDMATAIGTTIPGTAIAVRQ